MKSKRVNILTIVVSFFLLGLVLSGCGKSESSVTAPTAASGVSSTAKYVGSDKCGTCHQAQFADFKRSGHPWKLRKRAVVEQSGFYGLPDVKTAFVAQMVGKTYTREDGTQYTVSAWEDIAYIDGGYRWKARAVYKDGYIITGDNTNKGVQYNMGYNHVPSSAGWEWSSYNTAKKKKYDCGPCHMTGWNPDGTQDASMPGLLGSWSEDGIQCEECHGPGSDHVERRATMTKDTSIEACGRCHNRYWEEAKVADGGYKDTSSANGAWVTPSSKGYSTWGDFAEAALKDATTLANYTIPAGTPFTKHHQQFEDFISGPHYQKLTCTTCHDPHRKSSESIRVTCEECHQSKATAFSRGKHSLSGVTCIDCHMGFTSKSALGDSSNFKADIRNHLFELKIDKDGAATSHENNNLVEADLYINTDFIGAAATSATLTNVGGKRRAYPSWEYACKRCHKDATNANFVEYINCAEGITNGLHGINDQTTCNAAVATNYTNDVKPDWVVKKAKPGESILEPGDDD